MEEQLTRRQRRLLRKQEREKEQAHGASKRAPVGTIVGIVVAVVVVVGGGYGIWQMGKNAPGSNNQTSEQPTTTYTAGPVHWHAAFEVELCGKKQDFSKYGATTHAGSPLLHTHGDGLIHIEGRVITKEDIAVGKFFDGIDIAFDRDRIMDKKNGDECEKGKPGQVKMFVNGQPNTEFRDFVGNYTEKGEDTQIRIVFE